MEDIKSDEALRVKIINHLGEKIGEHAILKGGMVLRLLDCPRYTNDLDYVFIPFRSKNDIVALIQKNLLELPGLSIQHRLHSTNAQFDIVLQNAWGVFRTQVEANVAEACEAQALSTGDFALQYHQTPQVIRVMRFDVMFAHKLAAWNERRLMRDLYDAYFIFKYLNELPHLPTLQLRLQKVLPARRFKKKPGYQRMSLLEFCSELRQALAALDLKSLEEELRDYLDAGQLLGLDKKIRIQLLAMIESLEAVEQPQ